MTERARLTFNAESGVLLYPSSKGARLVRAGTEYSGRVTGNARVRALFIGIIGDPADVQHIRIRSLHVEESRERIVSARGFFSNYETERAPEYDVAPQSKSKKRKQVPVTVDAIAMIDLHDTMHEMLSEQRKTNELLAQLVEKWQ